jgi:CubicO group peptidase (beta-lactamase class C family)
MDFPTFPFQTKAPPMKKTTSLLALLFLFTICCSAQTNPNPSASVDAVIQSEMTLERFPGVSTLIVKNGAIVWVESYGFADVQNSIAVQDTTVFLLASMSKLFTGTASMQLYEDGVIDIDRNINTYLPWPVQIPGFTNDSVTPRQLMTHTSSIEDNYLVMDNYYGYPNPPYTLANCMGRYFPTFGPDYNAINNFHNQATGTFYDYSNIATALNGYVTEAASGIPFDLYCDTNIFMPLCMNKTSWNFNFFDSAHIARPYQWVGNSYVPYPHYGFADYPDGQLRSNVMDLANFMLAYLNGGTLGNSTILSPSSVTQMWTLQVPSLDPTQGLNWYQEEIFHSSGSAFLWGHNGGEMGVSTDMYLDAVNDIGIVVLTNGEGDALPIVDELYDYALSLNPASSIIPAPITLCNITISQVQA